MFPPSYRWREINQLRLASASFGYTRFVTVACARISHAEKWLYCVTVRTCRPKSVLSVERSPQFWWTVGTRINCSRGVLQWILQDYFIYVCIPPWHTWSLWVHDTRLVSHILNIFSLYVYSFILFVSADMQQFIY